MASAGAVYDVAVLGAGPAGAACALALSRAGVARVALVDGGARPGPAVGETIPPDTRLLFDRLGLWEAFLAEDHLTCHGSCSSWGDPALGFNDFVLNPNGPAWHLDRGRFDAFLRRQARDMGVAPIAGRLTGVDHDPAGGLALRLTTPAAGPRMLHARFAVDATGPAAALALRLGARRRILDRLTFVYGFFDAARAVSASRLTLLEAQPEGWWYAALLPGERLAVALAADAERVKTERLSEDTAWLRAALTTRHLAPRLDGCRFLPNALAARVAISFILDRVCGPRWLAIGDAAASYDPLCAQGLYKAIDDALTAAAAIRATLDADGDLSATYGADALLRFAEYQANRSYFYDLERRWPDSAFWGRRQARRELARAA